MQEIGDAGGQGYIEKFDVSDWKIKTQKFYVNSPIYKEYDVTGYGCCANTNGPLTAPFYYFDTFTKVSREKAKDKIVLVNGYLTYDTYKEIASSGAVGFITFSNDVYEDETNSDLDVRELRKLMSDIKKLPGVHMRSKDAMDLVKLNPETVTIEIEQEEFVSQSQNVISTIKGKMLEEEIASLSNRIEELTKKQEGFCTSAGIQYVCRAGNYAKKGLSYTGALRVLRVMMGYDYLWLQVRVKGGAYGCMCSFSSSA